MSKKYKIFDDVKKFVHSLDLETPSDWIDYWEENTKSISDIPRNPNIEYQNKGWEGWNDFLGKKSSLDYKLTPSKNYLSFSECRLIMRTSDIKSPSEWRIYSKSDKKPENVPVNPDIVYFDEWDGWDDFLGCENDANLNFKYPTIKKLDSSDFMENTGYLKYENAEEIVRSLKLKYIEEWFEYCDSGKKPNCIPRNPNRVYKWKGWKNWVGWLGEETRFSSLSRTF